MIITDLKLFFVPMRFLYLKIETDEGISGWGEPLVEGRAATLKAAVEEWRNFLIGRDPLKTEEIWQFMYRGAFYRGGPVMMSAMAGVDQALWDIKGKYYGVPVYQLINGGVKERVKVYRSIHGDTPEALAEDARSALRQGYRLIKCAPSPNVHYLDSRETIDGIVKMVAAAREAIGTQADLAVDLHGRIHRPVAKVLMKELDSLNLSFIEEPVLPTNNEALAELARYTNTPLATGERMYSRWDFKNLLETHTVDILQPDLSHAGGISECYRIAAMAEAYDAGVAPHCPLSVIAFAACLQLDMMAPTALFQEQSVDIHDCTRHNPKLQWIQNPEVFDYREGFVTVPSKPGLGIEVDEERVAEANRNPHDWKNIMWRSYDGTPIEW